MLPRRNEHLFDLKDILRQRQFLAELHRNVLLRGLVESSEETTLPTEYGFRAQNVDFP
jgi:hypothetical protein